MQRDWHQYNEVFDVPMERMCEMQIRKYNLTYIKDAWINMSIYEY